jgi:NADH-quinone oxidoreductase subunit M
VAATIATVLSAIYILWMYQRTMTGPVKEQTRHMPDLRPRELWAVGPLIALIIAFGVYPQPLLNIINPAVQRTLVQTHSTNPVPPHPARGVVHVGKSASGAKAAHGTRAASGTVTGAVPGPGNTGVLSQKGTAP